MRRLLAAMTMGLAALAMPVIAADDAAKKPATTKTAAGIKSMDPIKGRFHRQHNQRLKMACDTCHSGGQTDILFLRKDDVVPAGMPGQVNRQICLACHTQPNKPTWYGASAQR